MPEGSDSPGEFRYVPTDNAGFSPTLELPEGWTLGQDGSLYSNNTPTTNY